MALKFMDGFDLYPTDGNAHAMLGQRGWSWYSGYSAVVLSTTAGRYGGGAIGVNKQDLNWHSFGKGFSPAVTTLIAQGAVKLTSRSIGRLAELTYLGGFVAKIHTTATGALELYDCNGALIATSAADIFRANIWHYFQLKVTSANTTGTVILKVDGVTIFNYVGTIDTALPAGVGIDAILHYNIGYSGMNDYSYYDDLIYLDDSGASPQNDFLPDCRICTLAPNGDTATTDWIRSSGSNDYEMIDDIIPGGPDGDTTYLYTNTVGAKSQFDVGALPVSPTAVYGVQHSINLEKLTSDTKTARGYLVSNAVVQNGTTRTLATAYSYYVDLVQQDPDGPKEWAESSVNALQVGIELIS
jgi:hypothetical protein